MRLQQAICAAAALTLVLLGNLGSMPLHAGTITYQVNVNTSSLNGYTGYVDFQFNPGGSTASAATATITSFTGGTPIANAPLAGNSGNASGSLPGTLSLNNGTGTGLNDIFQGFTYGSSFSFQLTLAGPAVGNSGSSFGSSFALSLYDITGTTPLLTTDPNGSVLTINVNTTGTTSVETFGQSDTDSTPVAGASPLNATPEPSSLVLLFSALPAVLIVRRWRKRPVITV